MALATLAAAILPDQPMQRRGELEHVISFRYAGQIAVARRGMLDLSHDSLRKPVISKAGDTI